MPAAPHSDCRQSNVSRFEIDEMAPVPATGDCNVAYLACIRFFS